MVSADVIVFDMDGVLVDVRASYRDCIIATVERLSGHTITHETIQEYKNRGGFNNDWLLSQRLCQDLGTSLPYEHVAKVFDDLFFGTYMEREKWLPAEGLLERLSARRSLYIFTGRLHEEAQITLRRFQASHYFAGVLGDDNVARPKPAPDGLLDIRSRHNGARMLYLGDTVDDAASSAAAYVPFLGVGSHSGASNVIAHIGELEDLLA